MKEGRLTPIQLILGRLQLGMRLGVPRPLMRLLLQLILQLNLPQLLRRLPQMKVFQLMGFMLHGELLRVYTLELGLSPAQPPDLGLVLTALALLPLCFGGLLPAAQLLELQLLPLGVRSLRFEQRQLLQLAPHVLELALLRVPVDRHVGV